MSADCLIIGAAEHDREREREAVLRARERPQLDGWSRFLSLNFVDYQGDALMSHQLASLAYRVGHGEQLEKESGFFRYSDVSLLSSWRTPLLGGMFVYQYLKKKGFDVELVQHLQLQAERLDAVLRDEPKAIAISTTLITSPMELKSFVRELRRKSPGSFIILGGMTIWNQFQVGKADLEQSANGNGSGKVDTSDLMSRYGFLGADALIVDPYGVETLSAILHQLDGGRNFSGIPNAVFFEGGEAQNRLDRRPETFDLEKMRMDWTLLEDEHIGEIVNIRTQISCPFRCSFCSYPSTQGPVIKADLENFEFELQTLAKRGVKRLMMIDDTFNVPPKRFNEVLDVLGKYDFGWYAFIRCQFLKPEQVRRMKEVGCLGAYLGLESVDDQTLVRMNKTATVDDFHRGVDMLASADIATFASFIVGFPGDTVEPIYKLKSFVENSGLDVYNLKLFWYDHSTPIAGRAKEFGLTGQGYNWTHEHMDAAEACDLIQQLIVETKGRYAALHSGELWEYAQLEARGLSRRDIEVVYESHNDLMRMEIERRGSSEDRERVFSDLAGRLRHTELKSAPW